MARGARRAGGMRPLDGHDAWPGPACAGAALAHQDAGRLASFEQQNYYDQLDRVLSGTETRWSGMVGHFLGLVREAVRFTSYAVALTSVAPVLLLVAIAGVAPGAAVFLGGGLSYYGLLRQQTRESRLGDYNASLLTERGFAKEVRLYGLAGYALDGWHRLYWQTRDERRRLAQRQAIKARAVILAATMANMGALVWVVTAGRIHVTAGGYALLFQALNGVIQTLYFLANTLQTLGTQAGHASAVRAFFRLPSETASSNTASSDTASSDTASPDTASSDTASSDTASSETSSSETSSSDTASPATANGGSERAGHVRQAGVARVAGLGAAVVGAGVGEAGVAFPRPLRHSIRFEDVWFTYPGASQPALSGVTCEIRAGETVALVGENGAGKTTLVKLLLGLYQPDAGRITFDGIDAREIDPQALRAAASAVFQQFVHYHLTFRENVALGQPAGDGMGSDGPMTKAPDPAPDPAHETAPGSALVAAMERAVERAVEQAGAQDIVRALPQGYDTLLGPDVGGVDLSSGQWQRVALARAFYRPAQVLVLDEPTAALDPLAELAVFERFAALAAGRTAVLISHRLGMVRLAGRVIVLEQGRVAESGTYESLLRSGGAYAALFTAQARWYT
ncbi:MAG: ABC transporter ATP-binding protein [Chloroflexi bacterium]|nr:ABC transporter ATP-binding protein [Chloroflexota bacterium]